MTLSSSHRFKALTVTAGFSLWFFILTSVADIFTWWFFAAFVVAVAAVTQILAQRLSKALEIFATANTKIFLGMLFVFVISLYGVLFKILRIDLLRMKFGSNETTYWLPMENRPMQENLRQF